MAAAQAGHLDVVEALIEAGARFCHHSNQCDDENYPNYHSDHNDPHCSPCKTMWDGASPLFLAAQNGHTR